MAVSSEEAVRKGANVVAAKLRRDESYPSVADLVQTQGTSGEYGARPPSYPRLFRPAASTPLPEFVAHELASVKVASALGLFPEIDCAWASVDERLHVWSLKDDSVQSYRGLDQIILSVALVPAKADVFIDSVRFLIAVATPVEVVLIAVDTEDGQMTLHETKYSIPSDDVRMAHIVGANNGRIFMCGRDGYLYELEYFANDSWWNTLSSRKVRKRNCVASPLSSFLPKFIVGSGPRLVEAAIDRRNNILYTLSDESTIAVFDLGESGNDMYKMCEYKDVKHAAQSLFPALQKFDESSKVLHIVHIEAMLDWNAPDLNLVAVTRSGIRLYFSTGLNSRNRPSKRLSMRHVRLPPGRPHTFEGDMDLSAITDDQDLTLTTVHTALYQNGVFIYAEEQMPVDNVLFLVAPDTAKDTLLCGHSSAFSRGASVRYFEQASCLLLEKQHVWEVRELPTDTTHGNHNYRNELVMQHFLQRRKFQYISIQGTFVVEKILPIDELEELLRHEDGKSKAVQDFRDAYGVQDFCAMCLALATRNFKPAQMPHSPGYRVVRTDALADTASLAFFHHGGSARVDETVDKLSPERVQYSGCHEGFALYLSRLLRPVWQQSLIKVTTKDGSKTYSAQFTREECFRIEGFLVHLQRWANTTNFAPTSAAHSHQSAEGDRPIGGAFQRRELIDEALKEDNNSRASLMIVLTKSIEALALYSYLQDYPLQEILNGLKFEDQLRVESLNLSTLVKDKTGAELARLLVTSLIKLQHGEHPSQRVHEILAERCPSIFSESDAHRIRGYEALGFAHKAGDAQTRAQFLEDSLQEFLQIPRLLVDENLLLGVCKEYQFLRFYEGVASLTMACAEVADESRMALSWLRDGFPQDDDRRLVADQVLATIRPFQAVLEELQSNDDVMAVLDPRQEQRAERPPLTDDERDNALVKVLRLFQRNNNEFFHCAVYQWFVDHNQSHELAKLDAPFLEQYFKEYLPEPALSHELLAKYYVHHQQQGPAAIAFEQLASDSETRNLAKRIELLSHAVAHARQAIGAAGQQTRASTPFGTSFPLKDLQLIEDKLDVAKVQQMIYNEVGALNDAVLIAHIREQLDAKLYSLSDLYNQFATQYACTKSAFAILRASGQVDRGIIQKLWDNLFADALDNPNMNRLAALRATLIQLGREYYPDNDVFPLDVIIPHMEAVNLRHKELHPSQWSPWWAADALVEIGVPYVTLFRLYSEYAINKHDAFWKEYVLNTVRVLHHITGCWLKSLASPAVSPQDIRMFRDANVDMALERIMTELQLQRSDEADRLRAQLNALLSQARSSGYLTYIQTDYR